MVKLTESEEVIHQQALKALADYKALIKAHPNESIDFIVHKLTDLNLTLASTQPFVITMMAETGFFSTPALQKYLVTLRNEDHRTMAKAHVEALKLDEDDALDEFAKEMLRLQAKTAVRYYAFTLRDFIKFKGERINSNRMQASIRQKEAEILNNLKRGQEEERARLAEEQKRYDENEKLLKIDVIEWIQAAQAIPDYAQKFQQSTSLVNTNVECHDVWVSD